MLSDEKKPLRALVVDANAHIRRLVSTVLSALPIETCVEARCMSGAATLIREHNPDLIVLDMSADPTSAFLFANRVRRGELGRADTPILALAHHSHHAVLEEAWRAGIDDVTLRPLSALEILRQAGALIAAAPSPVPA